MVFGILSHPKYISIQNDGFVLFVICNVKAISFIPLLARLALELGLFEEEEDEEERGGLLPE